MRILPSGSHVSTIVWLHHLDLNETRGRNARWELHKDTVNCLEHILEVSLYKTAAVRPLTAHLTSHPSKINKSCWAQLEKQGQTHK